jgi:hypothetical protein
LHDRACEIFAQLKGGRVDYGEEHAARFGHNRYGRTFDVPLFPEWDEEHPIHLIGHSYGGCTILMIQQLLHERAFPGHTTNSRWVMSLTAISAPLQGCSMVYALGAEPGKEWRTRFGSEGFILGLVVHLWEFLDLRWAKRMVPMLDLSLDHFCLSWRNGLSALSKLVFSWPYAGTICADENNAAHDMTVHAMAKFNRRSEHFNDTYYFSFVGNVRKAAATAKNKSCDNFSRKKNEGIFAVCCAAFFALMISLFRFIFFGGLRLKRWQLYHSKPDHGDWDGLCTVDSQRAPSLMVPRSAESATLFDSKFSPQAGIWHSQELPGVDHLGIVPFPKSEAAQCRFFEGLFGLLVGLPRAVVPCMSLSKNEL